MKPLYGPPPDPQQGMAPTEWSTAPGPWIACLLLGFLLMFLGRKSLSNSNEKDGSNYLKLFVFVAGTVVTLTAPFLWYLPIYVYGAFPTIDKEGSLAFYQDGVMWRLLDPSDPGVRLIGVHLGHLWVTAFFDLFLAPFAAFNAQILLNLVLGWYCAVLLFEDLGARREAALAAAFPFGMGLHLFRDINWYTVEKTAVFWIPVYGLFLWRSYQRGGRWIVGSGLVFGLAFFMNAYWSLVCGGVAAWALILAGGRARQNPELRPHFWNLAKAFGASVLGGLPLALLQGRLMQGDGALGSPEAFAERAALDVFSLWPLAWNRLEGWAALEPILLLLSLLDFRKNMWYWVFMAPFFALSLGPHHNPLYSFCTSLIPGFWRVAKPEVFFEVTWLAILGAAAQTLSRRWRPGTALPLALLLLLSWGLRVRSHPVYPSFTLPRPVSLGPEWRR